MSKGKIADINPISEKLDACKKYYWCSCGLSKNKVFCDGSHAVTDMKPLEFSPSKSGEALLCTCKQTNNPPYCDWSHSSLKKEDIYVKEDDNVSDNEMVEPTKDEPALDTVKQMARLGI